MLNNRTGTRAIEGVTLKLPEVNDMNIETKAFIKLQKLRLLQLYHVQLNGGFENFSRELRWLCWHGFPLKLMPNNLYLGSLVAIDMQYSKLRRLWEDTVVLDKLKFLNLSHSHFLTRTLDFSKLPCLEELELEDCKSLVEVHHSIGSLEQLVLVNLKDCGNLKSFSWSYRKLNSLKTLILSGCSKLDKLPEDLGELKLLETLCADNNAIRQIPNTILQLTNLTKLSLCGYQESPSNSSLLSRLWSWMLPRRSSNAINLSLPSLQRFRHLKLLRLMHCNLSDENIPKDFGSLSFLSELDLQGNSFVCLPSGIGGLSNLHALFLNNCTQLQTITDLPTDLLVPDAGNCKKLERLPDNFDCWRCWIVFLANCHNILEAQRLDIIIKTIGQINLGWTFKNRGCNSEKDMQRVSVTEVLGGIFLPGKRIPDYFTRKNGSSITFNVPQFHGGFAGLEVCFICSSGRDYVEFEVLPIMQLINYSKSYQELIILRSLREIPRGDHIWKCTVFTDFLDIGSKDKVGIEIVIDNQVSVKEIGFCLRLGRITYVVSDGNHEEVDGDEAGLKAKEQLDNDEARPSYDDELPENIDE